MRKIQERTTYLNDNTLKDIIAAHLYAVSALSDDEEVISMRISGPDQTGINIISYQTIKDKEVDVIVHT